MQDERHIADGVLDALDQVFSLIGAHGAGHVLQADGVEAHGLQLLAHVDVLLDGVHRRLRIGNTAGGDGVLGGVLLGRLEGRLDVAEVVEGVENSQDVDAVLDGQLNKLFDDVVMVMLIAEQILAAKQHLQLRVRHGLADAAQPLPRIFAQIPQAGVERGAAPALYGVIPGLVHFGQNGLEIGIGQTGRHQGLVGVAQDSFRDLYFFHL